MLPISVCVLVVGGRLLLSTMDTKQFRYKKWAHLFHFQDKDKDGFLSFEEFMYLSVRLITSGQVEYGIRICTLYNTMWNKILRVAGLDVGPLQMDLETFQTGHDAVSRTEYFKNEFLPALISTYFDSVDTDHDGKINGEEWENLYSNRGITDEDYIKSTFKKMDTDGDGIISKEEFKFALEVFCLGEGESKNYNFLYDKKV